MHFRKQYKSYFRALLKEYSNRFQNHMSERF